MGEHTIKCRDGKWVIKQSNSGFFLSSSRLDAINNPVEQHAGRLVTGVLVSWNGVAHPNSGVRNIWQTPCYLPIAYLLCEAAHGTDDYDEARALAAGVIGGKETWRTCLFCHPEVGIPFLRGACGTCENKGKVPGPPDMLTPAHMLCDWMEERGYQCSVATPLGAFPFPSDVDVGNWTGIGSKEGIRWLGPLHAWCRHLIETRCLTCGGRRDGDDDYLGATSIVSLPGCGGEDRFKRRNARPIVDDYCIDCKYPKNPMLELDIPTIVRTT